MREVTDNENSSFQQKTSEVRTQQLKVVSPPCSAYILFIKDLKAKQDEQEKQAGVQNTGEKKGFLSEASKMWG